MIGLADRCNQSIGPYLQQGDVSRSAHASPWHTKLQPSSASRSVK